MPMVENYTMKSNPLQELNRNKGRCPITTLNTRIFLAFPSFLPDSFHLGFDRFSQMLTFLT